MVKAYVLAAILLTGCEKPRTAVAPPPPRDASAIDVPILWDCAAQPADFACGPNRCRSDQLCVTGSSGSQCMVGVAGGQYTTYEWKCVDIPDSCHGVPSCECVSGPGMCFGVQGHTVSFGCI